MPAPANPPVEVYDLEEELLQVKEITEASLKLADLKRMVDASKVQGSVQLYGCSRYRYSRGCCINDECHPKKFGVHAERLPHRYVPGTQMLKIEELQHVEHKYVVGGGGPTRFLAQLNWISSVSCSIESKTIANTPQQQTTLKSQNRNKHRFQLPFLIH